ncbi:MAG: hypothetical protein OXU96_04120 [Gammaproteobacteria bacterium]|nr:hypothetical protein [Gammaproteobacteria bacterium]
MGIVCSVEKKRFFTSGKPSGAIPREANKEGAGGRAPGVIIRQIIPRQTDEYRVTGCELVHIPQKRAGGAP